MLPKWAFKRHRAGYRARESQVKKFFRAGVIADRTTALIREGIQDFLDAVGRGTDLEA